MIHVIAGRATAQQIGEMLESLQTYIKVAVDVRQRVLAGGGEMHADCEAALLEQGSAQADIWGADWFPDSRNVRFQSLINIRPGRGNRSAEIADPEIRAIVEQVIRAQLDHAA
jgi:hypothetical protein